LNLKSWISHRGSARLRSCTSSEHSALSPQHSPLTAFTLIELLVVIAIVAILAAILFPVFAMAKMAAKKSASLSNLHQIGLAWSLYGNDYDNMLMRVHEAEGTKDVYWWASYDGTTLKPEEGLLTPFIGSKAVEADPTFDNKLRTVLDLTGYGYNYAYLSPSTYNPPDYIEEAIPVNEGQIGSPAETVAFATCARMNNWAYATPTLEGSTYLDPPSNNFPGFHGRSNGVGNILWCDGHANSRSPQLRSGPFGFGFNGSDFRRENLGDIDKDGDLTTDELFDLN
jgi:prepilin-type N-terminal cleavage/methylation domain-containing protein/prepilin-type processing-associated H-X9-DG protein